MANQATTNSARRAKNQRTLLNRRPGAGTGTRRSGATPERDDTYGLISVIYHALQGAETCAKYEDDARRAKNPELVAFFEDCQVEQNERALRGRQLLAAYLEGMDEADEEALEDDDAELEGES
jgi:hypothetical protein